MDFNPFANRRADPSSWVIVYIEPSLCVCAARLSLEAVSQMMPLLPSTVRFTIAVGPLVTYDGPVFTSDEEFAEATRSAFAQRRGRAPDITYALQRFSKTLELASGPTVVVFASDYNRHDVRDEDVYPTLRAIHSLGANPNLKAVAILGSDDGPDRLWIEMTFSNIVKRFDYVEARSADLAWIAEALSAEAQAGLGTGQRGTRSSRLVRQDMACYAP